MHSSLSKVLIYGVAATTREEGVSLRLQECAFSLCRTRAQCTDITSSGASGMSRSRLITLGVLVVVLTPDGRVCGQTITTDLAGDPLPPGAIARIGTTRYRVRGWHQQVFFSPDAATVIAKSEQGVLRCFEAATGKVTAEIKDPDLVNWSADLSPDGKMLAVFGADQRGKPSWHTTLRLYDLATRKPVWTSVNSEKHHSGDNRVRFTPDGKRLITAAQDVRVWDAKTGHELLRQNIPFQYGGLDVAPNGNTVALGGSQLYLWDWESGAEPRKIETGLRSSFNSLGFAPDSHTVYLLSIGGAARAVDVTTGKPIGGLEGAVGAQWIAFRPDGKAYAVGSWSGGTRKSGISLRDTATSKEIGRLESGTDHAAAACWSKDGSRFAAVGDNRVWVWDVKTTKLLGPDAPGHEAMISAVSFTSDGRLFTSSDDHTVRAWDATTGKELLKLSMDGWVRGMDVSRDGSLVVGSALRDDFRIWDARSGKQLFKLLGHGPMGGLRKVRFSADDQTLLSYGDDFYLRTWDTLTGKLKAEHRFRPPNPFGREDADEDDERMMMLSGNRASELGPDRNTLVLAAGKIVRVIAADTGKERFQFEADPQSVGLLVLSPDGKRLATAGPGVIPPKLKPGEMPARPTDYQVTVWDMSEAKSLTKFRVPGSSFAGLLMFTPDGRTVVTNSSDMVLRFWDAKTGTQTGTVELPERIGRVALDGAGKKLAVAFWDTTVVVYELSAVLKTPK